MAHVVQMTCIARSVVGMCISPLWCLIIRSVWSIDRYDAFSYRKHAGVIRRAIPWRYGWMAACAPVIMVSVAQLASTYWEFLYFAVVLAIAEVYSVCLHREQYVSAFEPGNLVAFRRPLGGLPVRYSDRRLQYLVRIHSLYVVGLLAACILLAAMPSSVVGQIAFLILAAKYVAGSWVDYEAYAHWDMHTNVLAMKNAPPLLERFWRLILECLLSPAVGSIPFLYSTEHIRLHHKFNGGVGDVNSPNAYDRVRPSQFCLFTLRTIFVLSTAIPITSAPELRGKRRRKLVVSVSMYWCLVIAAIFIAPAFSAWMIAALIYRSINTARAQYVWHGFRLAAAGRNPALTTVQWMPSSMPLQDSNATHDGDFFDNVGREGEWAYLDNYHLLHHLHPRAHFDQYREIVISDSERILSMGAVVLNTEFYHRFFECLMLADVNKIELNLIRPDMSASEICVALGSSKVQTREVSRFERYVECVSDSISGVVLVGRWVGVRERSSTLACREDVS
jgi:hypothetical protein